MSQILYSKDEESSGEASEGSTKFSWNTSAKSLSGNPFSFFNQRVTFAANPFRPTLKPSLTEQEKELLKDLLKFLEFDLDELVMRLDKLKISLVNFVRTLMSNMVAFRIPSPKQEMLFLQAMLNRNLLPEILLEKRNAKNMPEKENVERPNFHPNPYAIRLRPKHM